MKCAAIMSLAFCAACAGGKNIRRLDAVEEKYYQALDQRLTKSKAPMAQLIGGTRTIEERAVREVAIREARVEAASMVYRVREMLAAPKSDRAAFIQATRNKVVLLSLDKLAALEEASAQAQMAIGDEQRKNLDSLLDDLISNAHQVIETEKSLHRYLNQDTPSALSDVVAEVQRQLSAFNGQIATADSTNPALQRLADEANRAQRDVSKAKEDLDKFIEVWSRFNRQKE
jgi:hypothetical protein